ncbi:FHA domain-containing protein [Aurantimicrobium minutum]|uniref:FHA domain-containing protein n=1 Tax=Aurantimicrobium minutum TaxID=708131 RepID=UPI002474CCB0|nr:FHA domain-containing protein [Aurantimicrobium minutum]MDH6422890.1 hypothetical protein [Aurantimicrobium minutum]
MLCDVCQSALPEGALFCGECGSSLARTQAIPVIKPEPAPEAVVEVPAPAPQTHAPVSATEPETTSTNIVEQVDGVDLSELFDSAPVREVEPPRFATEQELDTLASFTITLGTGESVEITHSGLLGRMPTPAEGEEFEHLIVVSDPGRSVSKTHLEFGVDNGELWVADRNSGNGTIVREPGVVPRRAQPGTRYTVVRGTRLDFGDLHLTIS